MLKVIKRSCTSILATVALMLGCITPVFAENESRFKIIYPDQTEVECRSVEQTLTKLNKSKLEGTYTVVLLKDVTLKNDVTLLTKDLIIDGNGLTLVSDKKIITSNAIMFKNILLDVDKELFVGENFTFDTTVKFVEDKLEEDKKNEKNDNKETEDLDKPEEPGNTDETDPNLEVDPDKEDESKLDKEEIPDKTDPGETTDPEDKDDPKDPEPSVDPDDDKEPEEKPEPETNSWNVKPSVQNFEYGQTLNLVLGQPALGKAEDVVYTYSDKKDGKYTEVAPTNAGTWYIKASLAATEQYTGLEEIVEFVISPKKVTNITVPTIGPDTKLMEMVIKDGDKQLVVGTDYTVKMHVKDDTAIVTISFMNNYSGEIIKTYKVEKTEVKKPEKPKEEKKETKKITKKKGVQTSTSTNQTMWLTVLGLSVLVIVVLFFFKKKS